MDGLRRRVGALRTRQPAAVALAETVGALSVVAVLTGLVASLHPVLSPVVPTPPDSPFLLGAFLAYLVGFGGLSVAYARVRGFEIPVGPPREVGFATVASVLAPAVLVGVTAVATNYGLGLTLSETSSQFYSPQADLGALLVTRLPIIAFGAIGIGLLVSLVAHETLRRRLDVNLDRRHAAFAVAAVVVTHRALQWSAATTGFGTVRTGALGLFALGVVALVAAGFGAGLLYDAVTGDPATDDAFDAFRRPIYVPVLALGLLGAIGAGQELLAYPELFEHLLWGALFVAAAYGYDRTRTVWTPIVTVLLFQAAIAVVLYLEAVGGFTGMPA